jgi:hypothetical protein
MSKLVKYWATAGIFALVLLTTTIAIQSCGKNKPCKANITVIDQASGSPLGGVTVRLEPSGTSPTGNPTIAPIESSTDASGKVSFETQLPKIMDIIVVINGNPTVTGKVARFEEGKTDDVVVEL